MRAVVILLFLFFFPSPLFADKDNFVSWLLRTWSDNTPASVYYENPPIIFIYVEHKEWTTGKDAWQKDAGRRIACTIPETFPEWKIRPPFYYKLLIYPPPSGGAVKFFQDGIITKDSCGEGEKTPIFHTTLPRQKFTGI